MPFSHILLNEIDGDPGSNPGRRNGVKDYLFVFLCRQLVRNALSAQVL